MIFGLWDQPKGWIRTHSKNCPLVVNACTVKYMMKNARGSMRQPVFKGIRDGKEPKDCIIH